MAVGFLCVLECIFLETKLTPIRWPKTMMPVPNSAMDVLRYIFWVLLIQHGMT